MRFSGAGVTTSDAVPGVLPALQLEARVDAAQVVDQEDDAFDVAHAQDLARLQPRQVGLDDARGRPASRRAIAG